MKRAIDNIVKIVTTLQVTVNQAVYLVSLKEGMNTVTIDSTELIDLINRGHVNGNALSQETLSDIEKIVKVNTVASVKKQSRVTYPILTEDTAKITKRLAKHFLGDTLTGVEYSRIEAYVPNNSLQVPFLFIFMQMFPSSVRAKNRHWERKFSHEWNQPSLRRLSTGTANKFKQIWKTRDIGLFLLGTFLFIQHSYSEDSDKFYIKKIENYLKEYQTWYEMAEDQLATGKLDHVTSKPLHRSNTWVPQ